MSKAEITPIPESLILAISSAYADSDSTLARRVKVIRRAMQAGYTVKSITESMAAAAASDPSITAVTATIYGYAAAASGVIDSVGADETGALVAPSSDQLATLARAAKHVGVGPFKTAVRTVLAPLGDDITPEERLVIVVAMAADALANVRPDRARAATRAARPNDGVTDGDDAAADVPNNEHVHPVSGKPDAAEVLATIRRATKYLQRGGTVDADLAGAISDFVAAAAKASARVKAAA